MSAMQRLSLWHWRELEKAAEAVLREHPAGLSEFALIRCLQAAAVIDRDGLRDPLSLYRTHFMLFHALYRMADRLVLTGEDVQVHCTRCRIVPRATPGPGLREPDPMRAFYLDRRNLEQADAEWVERLIGDFWRRFHSMDRRGEALAVLGLRDPVSDADIKAAYRQLAMRHHPDRGGDTATLQRLNRAVSELGV